jgi:hypothetical protein
MNGRWWFWNIAFSLLPAFLIFVYMEFRVKPIMIAFYADQEQQQGHSRQGTNQDDQQQQSQKMQHLGGMMQTGSSSLDEHSMSLGDRFTAAWHDLQSFLSSQNDSDEGTNTEISSVASPTTEDTRQDSSKMKKTTEGSSSSSLSGDGGHDTHATNEGPTIPTKELTLQTLAQRLERLESYITTQYSPSSTPHQQIPSGSSSQSPPLQQSGIHTRRLEHQRRQAEAAAAGVSTTPRDMDERVIQWVADTSKSVFKTVRNVWNDTLASTQNDDDDERIEASTTATSNSTAAKKDHTHSTSGSASNVKVSSSTNTSTTPLQVVQPTNSSQTSSPPPTSTMTSKASAVGDNMGAETSKKTALSEHTLLPLPAQTDEEIETTVRSDSTSDSPQPWWKLWK